MILVVIFIVAVIGGFATAEIARRRSLENYGWYFLLGFFVLPVGLIVACLKEPTVTVTKAKLSRHW